MRKERIRKTPSRRLRRTEFPPLNLRRHAADVSTAEDVLDRIHTLLEAT